MSHSEPAVRSGFIAVLGRPNVGKSSLVNRICGAKVSITSWHPNTTRTAVRGVLDGAGFQAVFVDTPGIHRPRTALGNRLNEAATGAVADVEACLFVLDAAAPVGRGDAFIAERLPVGCVVALNKIDKVGRGQVLAQLGAAAALPLSDAEFFPVSARTGQGVAALVDHLVSRLPEGPRYYPAGMVRDVPEAVFVAELVREQLLRLTREELPHSIACRVSEWEWPYIRCDVVVERASQKGIVIGHGGELLKAAGTAARAALPAGTYLDLRVVVEPDWQRRPEAIERLGY